MKNSSTIFTIFFLYLMYFKRNQPYMLQEPANLRLNSVKYLCRNLQRALVLSEICVRLTTNSLKVFFFNRCLIIAYELLIVWFYNILVYLLVILKLFLILARLLPRVLVYGIMDSKRKQMSC